MTQAAVHGPNCRGGTVVAVRGSACTVQFSEQRCEACDGHCAMNVFGADTRRLTMRTRDGSAVPDIGAGVWVAVAERAILRAAIGLFALPLVGMVVGAWIASVFGVGEAAAAGLAGSGLAVGCATAAFAIRRWAPTDAMLYDGHVGRGVTLLNHAVSSRSDARFDVFKTGKSRIT